MNVEHLTGPTEVAPVWVVVPFRNEAALLPATLTALARQTLASFTLLLVDNASTDGSVDEARHWCQQAAAAHRIGPAVTVLVTRETERGVGAAADTGFRYAIAHGATHLLRTDADTLPAPDWAERAVDALDGGLDMAAGVCLARRDETTWLGRAGFACAFWSAAAFGRIRPAHRDDAPGRYLMTAGHNMAIRPAVYEASGGLPRTPAPTDTALVNRVRAVTGRLGRVRRMRVETSIRRLRAYGATGTAAWYLGRGSSGRPEDVR